MVGEEKVNLLLVDDDPRYGQLFKDTFEDSQIHVSHVRGGQEALEFINSGEACDIAILDVILPGFNGIELLQKMKSQRPDMEMIVVTGQASIQDATNAMRYGAFDYLQKPFSLFELEKKIFAAIQRKEAAPGAQDPAHDRRKVPRKPSLFTSEIIGESEDINIVRRLIARVAKSDSPILIESESGTGKEVVANAIHRTSLRREGPFIAVNCGALPEHLLENELFGHEKGAFTDATAQKRGLFEVAKDGTLFIDEIGEMSASLQVKLLRVLESEEFRRLGGTEVIHTNVRIIAATNKNLQQAVERGDFRQDLYYRLNVIPLTIPPLRHHKSDIPLLVENFMKSPKGQRISPSPKTLSPKAMDILMGYDWPGNVRELYNVIERALVLCAGRVINADDLPLMLQKNRGSKKYENLSELKSLQELERDHIKKVLDNVADNKVKAAKILGISRQKLYRKLGQFEGTLPSDEKQ